MVEAELVVEVENKSLADSLEADLLELVAGSENTLVHLNNSSNCYFVLDIADLGQFVVEQVFESNEGLPIELISFGDLCNKFVLEGLSLVPNLEGKNPLEAVLELLAESVVVLVGFEDMVEQDAVVFEEKLAVPALDMK